MKAIKKELGEDEGSVDHKELEEKLEAAKLPKEAKVVAMKELDRLSRIPLNRLNIMFQEHILSGYQIYHGANPQRIE